MGANKVRTAYARRTCSNELLKATPSQQRQVALMSDDSMSRIRAILEDQRWDKGRHQRRGLTEHKWRFCREIRLQQAMREAKRHQGNG